LLIASATLPAARLFLKALGAISICIYDYRIKRDKT
jgi:hypothetical protein